VFDADLLESDHFDSNRVAFFDGTHHGFWGINRDDGDGGITSPIYVGTNTINRNGVYLTMGGTCTNISSRTFKENFTPFNGEEQFRKISNLSITT
jgi:hypothetical protein